MDKNSLISHLKLTGYSNIIVNAIENVDRTLFVPEHLSHLSYSDYALPTSEGQTISQPSCIAMMFNLLELDKIKDSPEIKILEIGSGTGYVLALFAQIFKQAKIFGLEIKSSLITSSINILKENKNISIIQKSGINGFEKESPYDIILISASAQKIKIVKELVPQLKDQGIILSPVGFDLIKIKKISKKIKITALRNAVSFVPLIDV
jgi:protein-L-isoaspartate(D-aspartate) O-methyltransferase